MTDRATHRDLFIDFLRVAAVVVVVLGHWLTTTVIWEPGVIDGENALSVVSESHLATWVLQVMPLLFFVGGFSNTFSLARHQGRYLSYLRSRYGRLLTPTLVFLGIWLLVGIGAQLLPLPQPNVVEKGADIAALPFWFLGIYVVVVAVAPVMWRLHRRYGWWVPSVMVAGALIVDVLHHGVRIPNVGVANYAFVWLLPHQLGFFYANRRLRNTDRRVRVGMALAGLAGLVVLTALAGYPTSMVGVPGEERWNTNPPSLAIVMVTAWLVGLALLARPVIMSWLEKPGPSWLIGSLNRVPLTMYLWHVTAVTVAASIIFPLGFPRSETGTTEWWVFRPLWMATLIVILVVLVRVFRRFEIHPGPREEPPRDDLPVRRAASGFAVVSLGLGLLGFGTTGFDRILSEAGESILAFTTNPAQNVLHMIVGLSVLQSVFDRRPGVRSATILGAVLYVGLGIVGLSGGINLLAMNSATAVLHIGVGAAGLIAVLAAGRRTATEPSRVESGG